MIFEAITTGLFCMIYVVLFVLLSQTGLYAFDLWYCTQKKPSTNEAAGLMFGAISLIYSLLLAFVIVAVWTDYEDLTETIGKEADKLNSILAHSSTLSDSMRIPLNRTLTTYCNRVMNSEWNLEEGEMESYPSAIPDLRLYLLRTQPDGKVQEGIYSVIDDDLSSISDLRRERLDHVRSHVPRLVWLILKTGSVMMIIFSYFLEVPFIRLKRIYLFFLSSIMAMSLFLVNALDDPFNGAVAVSKRPYENVLHEIQLHPVSYPTKN